MARRCPFMALPPGRVEVDPISQRPSVFFRPLWSANEAANMGLRMARLILVTAEGGQQAIELRAVNSLGRHPNNSIQLLDKIVSKEHCIIEQRGAGFVLRDLGSLNGTYI